MKLESYVSPGTKINSKWIKDLNLLRILKFLYGNVENILQDIDVDYNFLNRASVNRGSSPKYQQTIGN